MESVQAGFGLLYYEKVKIVVRLIADILTLMWKTIAGFTVTP